MSENKKTYEPHPQWFIDQHTKMFHLVADDADNALTSGSHEGMYHPHGITESTYRHYIWDLIFSGRRILEERDRYREKSEQFDELLEALEAALPVLTGEHDTDSARNAADELVRAAIAKARK